MVKKKVRFIPELDKIYEEGSRLEEIEKESQKQYTLSVDPLYGTPISRSALEGRDPSKSGGGYSFNR